MSTDNSHLGQRLAPHVDLTMIFPRVTSQVVNCLVWKVNSVFTRNGRKQCKWRNENQNSNAEDTNETACWTGNSKSWNQKIILHKATHSTGRICCYCTKSLAYLPGWPDRSAGLAKQPCCYYAHTREREVLMEIATKNKTEIDKQT